MPATAPRTALPAPTTAPTTGPTRPPATGEGGMFRSLQNRNYRLFFIGQLVSIFGSWMQSIAQSTYVLYRLDGGGRELGILSACQFVPVLVFGLWAGAIADRHDKRRILIAAQVLMGLSAVALTIAVVIGRVPFSALCAIAFVSGIGNAFDMPTRQAFVSEMVPPEDLPNAVGLNSAMFNTGRIAGQAIAGLVVSAFGYAWCFGLNAASFGAIIVGYALMRSSELRARPRGERAPGQIAEGLRYIRRVPILRTVLFVLFVVGTFSMNFQVFTPLLAKSVFHGKESKVAFFQVMAAIGSLLGSLRAARRGTPSSARLIGALAMFTVTMAALAMSRWEPVTAALLVVVGFCMMTVINTVNATLQLSSDPAMRGRVMALYTVVFVGTTPVGAPLVGWTADRFGPRQSVGFAAAAAGVAAVLAMVAARRGALTRTD